MSPQEKIQLKRTLVLTALYYSQEIADSVLDLFVEDLEDLPLAKVLSALKEIRRDPKCTKLPLPAAIRGRVTPDANPEDAAREAASKIIAAVTRFGWTNADKAREYIGPIGWEVVKLQGGWQPVCELLNSRNTPTLQSQWRELAVTVQRSNHASTDAQQIEGPTKSVNVVGLLKSMPGGSR